MKTLVAAGIGAVAMGLISAGAYAVTQRRDPSMSTLGRTSQIGSVLAIVAGLWWAKKKNALQGAAIATAGAAMLVSVKIASLVGGALSKPTTPAMAAVYGNMGAYARMNAVYGNISGYQRRMGAYGPQMGRVGAVYGNIAGIGATRRLGGKAGFVPAPNWHGNPF